MSLSRLAVGSERCTDAFQSGILPVFISRAGEKKNAIPDSIPNAHHNDGSRQPTANATNARGPMEVLPSPSRTFHRHRISTNDPAVTGGHVTRVLNRKCGRGEKPDSGFFEVR